MIQQHPYCRTCGSMVRSKKVCHYCGCEPLKGHHYCCDCGTSTLAEAVMCVQCGASLQNKFPVTLAVLISIALAITIAGTGYFIAVSDSDPAEVISQNNSNRNTSDSIDLNKIVHAKTNEAGKIIINNPANLIANKNEAISRIAKNLPLPRLETANNTPPDIPERKKEETRIPDEKPPPSGRISMNVFSSREMRGYAAGCTYFTGGSKNNVVFFTTNVYGYVKINGKVYALQGIQKGNDIARFSGAGYELTIEIEGLAGNEKEWLAEALLVVKDVRQKTLTRHKIYSACTDF